jgi:7-cyano-7-deazaguanine synthase
VRVRRRVRRTARVCALVSGGLDSAVLVRHYLDAGCEVHPLYVENGYIWERAEKAALRRVLRALAQPRLKPLSVARSPLSRGMLGPHWGLTGRGTPGARSPWDSVYLPARNVVLLAEAAVLAATRGLDAAALGLLKGNPFGDASPRFLRAMSQALTVALGRPFRAEAPFLRKTKRDVARAARGLPLVLTFSCLRPARGKHCGSCSKCEERRRALAS